MKACWIQYLIALFLFFDRKYCSSLNAGPFPVLIDSYVFDLYKFIYIKSISALSKQWKLNGVYNSSFDKTTTCGNFTKIFGGLNLLKGGDIIERDYDALPSHSIVFYYLKFHLIDDWKPGDLIELMIDDQIVFSFQPSEILGLNNTFIDQCGNSNLKDVDFTIVGATFHSSSSLTFSVKSYPTNLSAFYGLIDLRMRLKQARPIDTQFSYIKSNYKEMQALSIVSKCPNWYYAESNGASIVCKPCHASCGECTGPTINDCITCQIFYTYDINLDACVKCDSDCAICRGSNPNQCGLCQPSKMLYWNYSCKSSCNSPYVKDALDLSCMTPCQTTNTYMLSDNSCSDSCVSPLIPRIEGEAKFCDSPCDKTSMKYLYWDGTCQESCNFSPRTTGGFLFCDACSPGYFMYPNKTCFSNCSYPFKQRTHGGSIFCDYPCDGNSKFFDQEKKICKKSCDYPYQVRDEFYCVFNLSEKQEAQVKATVSTLVATETATTSIGTTIGIINVGNPSSIFVNAYIGMFGKIKYMEIRYPPKLLYFFQTKTDERFLKMSDEMIGRITKHSIPDNFDQYHLHSNFIVNFYQELIITSAIGVIIIIIVLIGGCFKTSKLFQLLIGKISKVFKWNLSLTLFTSYFGDMVLFTSLEIHTNDLTSFFSVASYIVCFFINLLAFSSLIKIVGVLSAHWDFESKRKMTEGTDIKDVKSFQDSLISFEVVFKQLQTKSIFQQVFMFLFIIRVYVYSIVVGYFCNHTLFQTISMIVFCLSMLGYLLLTRPFKSTLDLCQFILLEVVTLIIAICLLVLNILDKMQLENAGDREVLGELILYCNMAYNGITSVYLVLRILLNIRQSLQKVIDKCRKKKTSQTGNSNSDKEHEFVKDMPPQASKVLEQERVCIPKIRTRRHTNLSNVFIRIENLQFPKLSKSTTWNEIPNEREFQVQVKAGTLNEI